MALYNLGYLSLRLCFCSQKYGVSTLLDLNAFSVVISLEMANIVESRSES